LNSLNLPFKRFTAYDGLKFKEYEEGIKLFNFHLNTTINMTEMKEIANKSNSQAGEIGQWQSHLQLYFEIVENARNTGNDHPVLILEDDIILDMETPMFIKGKLEYLKDNYEMLFLSNYCYKVNSKVCELRDTMANFAYIIKNSSVAMKIIEFSNTPYKQIAGLFWNSYHGKELNSVIVKRPIIQQDPRTFKSDIRLQFPPLKIFVKNPIMNLTLEETELGEIFVINSDKRPDRFYKMRIELNTLRLPFTRISAFDDWKIPQWKGENIFNIHPNTKLDLKELSQMKVNNYGKTSIWQSHLQVYFKIVDNAFYTGIDKPIMILEDNIEFNFEIEVKEIIQILIKTLPDDWEVIYLGAINRKCNIYEKQIENACKLKSLEGTYGFIIRNSEVAKKLINFHNIPKLSNITDFVLYKTDQLKAYLSDPHLINLFINDE
jgi:GR25 family glycosyltransferase involved in LPS biosynthesis